MREESAKLGKKYFQVAFIVLLLTIFQVNVYANQEVGPGRNDFPPVLMYHDIKVKPINGFDVSRKDFVKQLDWLIEQGYHSLSLYEFLACSNSNLPFPEKSILITFDDGYEGIYQYAAPELTKRNMHATFFVFSKGINSALPGYPYVTDTQLKELAANSLFSIQSHTITHADLSDSSLTKIQQEVEESKTFIENFTRKPCRVIAYPYGHYNREVLQVVEEAGYEAAFSVSDLGLMDVEAKYTIPRIYMGVLLGENDMELFKKYIAEYKNMPPDAFKERFGDLPQ